MQRNIWTSGGESIVEESPKEKNIGFINHEIRLLMNEVILYDCGFDFSQYNPKLFKEFDIYFPLQIQRSAIKRQAEFLAGRYAAQQAILNIPLNSVKAPIIHIGGDRSPLWPSGIKGSIAHSNDRALCAVMVSDLIDGSFIGIDIEDYLSNDTALMLASSIHTEREKFLLVEQGIPSNVATTLIFSAKESLFKAMYPFVCEYFDFECAEIIGANLNENYLIIRLSRNIAQKVGFANSLKCYFRLDKTILFTIISGSAGSQNWQNGPAPQF